uniref:VWFD domain-containing protein n=1 Tax=Periophthalmus magnuspinnatus TaxID=409849 RepID=A0A3B3ZZ45_9GOBI
MPKHTHVNKQEKGICVIHGDPHYITFDGKTHHFQGPCTYVLSQQCGSELTNYRVEVTRSTVCNTIRFLHVVVLQVNGIFKTTPISLINGAVFVYTLGFSVFVSTDFGLEVSYNADALVTIKVPYRYQGATCGLCGNFNNDPDDDFQTPEGDIVSSLDFGKSWQVLSADEPECAVCEGPDCYDCPEDKKALFRNSDHCGILQDTSGPFAACHHVLSPETFVESCVYDLCLEGGQQNILCQALNVYASECQNVGVQLQNWRRPGFCGIHFESQSTGCPATCVKPEIPDDCARASVESCACNEGYVLSGADCVPVHECGCNFEGFYYHSGKTVILDQDCSRICDCISGNMTCHSHVCESHEECKVFNGERGCYARTCSVSGDPLY